MELFSRKKKNTDNKEAKSPEAKEQKAAKKTSKESTNSSDALFNSTEVLVRPHITEKAAVLADANGYVFVVSPRANKADIKRAIKDVYGKEPVKVNILKKPGRSVLRRKGRGTKKGYTKAYVFLKKGETIDIV